MKAKTRTEAHTATSHIPARSCGLQAECAHKHTRPNTSARFGGMKAKNGTDTHTPRTRANMGGVQTERAHKHTHPNTAASNGGAQPKPQPKHTQTHRTPQPGRAGYRRSAHTNTHTPTLQHEWRGEDKTQTQGRTPTPHTPVANGVLKETPVLEHTQHRPQAGMLG